MKRKIKLIMQDGSFADSIVADYNSRIISAGGSLSSNDKTIVSNFVNYLNTNSIWNKISDIGIFMGGFSGCFVKLKYADSSFKSLLNTNFVSADYGESTGLSATGSTKFCDTQIIPSSYGLSKNNFSFGCHMVKDISTSFQYLLCDNQNSGRNRIELQKGFIGVYDDGGTGNITRNGIQVNVNDPHFTGLSMGTNILVMENYQKDLLPTATPVTSNTLSLNSNIRVLRGRDSGSDIGGGGAIGGYFLGQTLTYGELRLIQKAFETLLIAKGRITPTAQCITFGDSITLGQGASTYTNRYSYKLASLFGLQERNNGIPSSVWRADTATIPGGYGRISELLDYNLTNANTKIIIQYGVNDYASGTGVTTDFTNKLVTACQTFIAAGVSAGNIQIGSPSLTNNGTPTATQQAFRDAASAAAHTAGVKFADVWQYLTDNGGTANLSADNLHPNDTGHNNIATCHFSNANFV